MAPLSSFLSFGLIALQSVTAHPGHNVRQEAAEKADFFKLKPRTVRDCAAQLQRRGVTLNGMQRRKELARSLRAKRGLLNKRMLGRRDFSDYDFSHQSSDTSIDLNTDPSSLFADNSSCTLQTDVTQGPYYVRGELIRQDVTDGEDGIPLYVDIQVIDTSSCEPISGIYMDFWHANATGVYSGVVANGNGDSSDTSNLDSTAMRGIQQTDSNGLVQFYTKFPGHYTGRATHIHIMTHNADDTSAAENGTLLVGDSTTHASHVGQLFFDQDLITQVSQISPYSESTAQVTENSDDSILAQEADTTDPFVEYVLLGSELSDGLLAWISVGIDPSKDSEVSAAATYYESGGVANSNSMSGGPGGSSGGPGGNDTMSGGPGGNSTSTGGPGGNNTTSGGPGGNATTGGTPPDASGSSGATLPTGTDTPSGTNEGPTDGSAAVDSSSPVDSSSAASTDSADSSASSDDSSTSSSSTDASSTYTGGASSVMNLASGSNVLYASIAAMIVSVWML